MNLQDMIQQLSASSAPQQRHKPTREDWGRMLMAFGAGAAGSDGSIGNALSRGAGGVANHVEGRIKERTDKRRDKEDKLWQLRLMDFRDQSRRDQEARRNKRDDRIRSEDHARADKNAAISAEMKKLTDSAKRRDKRSMAILDQMAKIEQAEADGGLLSGGRKTRQQLLDEATARVDGAGLSGYGNLSGIGAPGYGR